MRFSLPFDPLNFSFKSEKANVFQSSKNILFFLWILSKYILYNYSTLWRQASPFNLIHSKYMEIHGKEKPERRRKESPNWPKFPKKGRRSSKLIRQHFFGHNLFIPSFFFWFLVTFNSNTTKNIVLFINREKLSVKLQGFFSKRNLLFTIEKRTFFLPFLLLTDLN